VLLKYRRKVRLLCWGKPLKKQKHVKRNTFFAVIKNILGVWVVFMLFYLTFTIKFIFL